MPNTIGKGSCLNCQVRPQTIFAGLNERELEQMQPFQPPIIQYAPNETIYMQGSEACYVFTLRQGFVKIVNTLSDGRAHIVQLLRDGDFFGFGGCRAARINTPRLP